MKLNTTIKTLCAAVAFAASAAASAAPIYLNVGTDYGDNGSGTCITCTGVKDELNLDYTSITTFNFSTMTFSTEFGWNKKLDGTSNLVSNYITSLDPGLIADNGYGASNWFLAFSGLASGTFTAVGQDITSLIYKAGSIDMFVFPDGTADLGTYQKFMTIAITGGAMGPGNTEIVGKVTSTTGTYANLFNSVYKPSCSTGNSFTEILECGDAAPVYFKGDLNTYDPTLSATKDPFVYTATGEHNGSASFAVPEPASLALFGLGLFGLGAIRRRKSA